MLKGIEFTNWPSGFLKFTFLILDKNSTTHSKRLTHILSRLLVVFKNSFAF